jgi:putative transposase
MVRDVAERRGWRVAVQQQSTQRRPVPPNPYRDRPVARMRELAVANPLHGHRDIMDLLHKGRWTTGSRLLKRRKRSRIGTGKNGIVRRRATREDEVWGMDFESDHTVGGRPLRLLVVRAKCTRECPAIEVGRQCLSEDLVRALDELRAIRGAPVHIRSDNGPDPVSAAVPEWCE